MATIIPHTTRATGTLLTAAIYNTDHQVHITNANSINDELAGVIDVSSNTGLIVSNGAGVISGRSLEVANGLTIANANGVAGNPSIGVGALSAATSVEAPFLRATGAGSAAAPAVRTGNTTTGLYGTTSLNFAVSGVLRATLDNTGLFTPGSIETGAIEGTTGEFSGTLTAAGATLSAALTVQHSGQNIINRASNATTGPAYMRFQTGDGTNIGYIGMGGASTAIQLARNTTGDIEIDTAGGNLDINSDIDLGTFQLTGTGTIFNGTFRGLANSAASPTFSWTGDTNTGFYNHAPDEIGISAGGVRRGNFTISAFNWGREDASSTTAGASFTSTGQVVAAVTSDVVIIANRLGSDGPVIHIRHANVTEGTIETAGATVSYNAFLGSHWSQLKDGSNPEILKGTVCETIDEMSVWPDEPVANDRLPKFKVSDTPGSSSVYGIFLAWDEDGDAMVSGVGAGWVRMDADEVVERGDLVESAGNGCARVQADNVVRSSTVAKISSTVVAETYPDGSYLVPCTLHCG